MLYLITTLYSAIKIQGYKINVDSTGQLILSDFNKFILKYSCMQRYGAQTRMGSNSTTEPEEHRMYMKNRFRSTGEVKMRMNSK